MRNHTLSVLSETLAICRLEAGAPLPDWAYKGSFSSITRTDDELSIVCPQFNVPEGIRYDRDWRALKVNGPLDLSLSGVLASLVTPLARARIPTFALATYDTDYLLVKSSDLEKAKAFLFQEGYLCR